MTQGMDNSGHPSRGGLPATFGWVVCCMLLTVSPPSTNGQDSRVELSVGYPLPASGVTLPDAYVGKMHLGLSYSYGVRQNYRIGVGSQYTRFQGEIFYDVTIHLLTPSLHAAYLTELSRQLGLEGTVRAGYGWVFNRTDDTVLVSELDASGPFLSGGAYLTYTVSREFSVRSGLAYSVIFQQLREDLSLSDNSVRYFTITTGFALTL